MKQQLFHLQELPPGSLIRFCSEAGAHQFEFDNMLTITAYSGWRLINPTSQDKTVLGSRDLEGVENGLDALNRHLGNCKLNALVLYAMDDRFLAFFESPSDESIRLEIFMESSKGINWRVSGEDFEDTDQLKLIQNLD